MARASTGRRVRFPFIAVAEVGVEAAGGAVVVGRGGALGLRPGEQVWWQGRAGAAVVVGRPGGRKPSRLELIGNPLVTVSDQRVTFVLDRYDPARHYGGFSVDGWSPGRRGGPAGGTPGASTRGRRRRLALVGQVELADAVATATWERRVLRSVDRHLAVLTPFETSERGRDLGHTGLEVTSSRLPVAVAEAVAERVGP